MLQMCHASAQKAISIRVACTQVHDMAQARRCQHKAHRIRGARMIPKSDNVGAVRVSASGWEGWVLDGLQVSWTPA